MHLATLEMDAGPILAQEVVPVLPGDTEETLHERIKVVERPLYPATVAWALAELEAGREIGRRPEPVAGGDRRPYDGCAQADQRRDEQDTTRSRTEQRRIDRR